MKDNYAADTMAVVLRLERRVLPVNVKDIFAKAESGDLPLFIPAMVVAEIGYLAEKNRIDMTLHSLMSYIQTSETLSIAPINELTVVRAFEIDDIPELHDRLIAAAAAQLKARLITNDPVISSSRHVDTLW